MTATLFFLSICAELRTRCVLARRALIESVNTRFRLRVASKKRIFTRLFRIRALFATLSPFTHATIHPSIHPLSHPFRRLCLSLPYLRLSSLQTRILLRTVSRQTSLTDFTPLDFHDRFFLPPASPPPRLPSPPPPATKQPSSAASLQRSSRASPIATFFGKSF